MKRFQTVQIWKPAGNSVDVVKNKSHIGSFEKQSKQKKESCGIGYAKKNRFEKALFEMLELLGDRNQTNNSTRT